MLRLRIRVPAANAVDLAAELLPYAPHGVHELPEGDAVALVLHGPEEAVRAVHARTGGDIEPAPDDARERLAEIARPAPVGVLQVRSDWMAPVADDDLVLVGDAFGSGAHPTTRMCLELLQSLEPRGSFADLGCGTGVLAIAAARLGFAPVEAVDHDEAAVEATRANAAANGVELRAFRLDLLTEPVPAAATLAANVPTAVQLALARPAEAVIASGFGPADAAAVAAAYGMAVSERREETGWVALLLRPGAPPPEPLPVSPGASATVEIPAATRHRIEQGARVALVQIGEHVHLDAWPQSDSLGFALRVYPGARAQIIGGGADGRRVVMSVRVIDERGTREVDVCADVGPGPVHELLVGAAPRQS